MKRPVAYGSIVTMAGYSLASAVLLQFQCSSPPAMIGESSTQGGTSGTSIGAAGKSGGISIALASQGGAGGMGGGMRGGSDAGDKVAPSSDANCGAQTSNASPQPADILLVLDRSGSMNDDIASNDKCGDFGLLLGCTARWPTMTTALNQVFAAASDRVNWGLKLFASPGGGQCGVTPEVEVAVGPNTTAQIQAAIAATRPGDQTPTTAAINAAAAYLGGLSDGLPRYILLATDGRPNCDPGNSGSNTAAAAANTVAAIAAAASAGVKTYVIGIGPAVGNLDSFAAAGGTGNFYPATSPAQLAAALGSIVGAVASCVFSMNSAPPDPSNIGVYLDKTTKVPLSTTRGYSLDASNKTLTFTGDYCDGIKNGTYKLVQVFFGCPGEPNSVPMVIP